MLSKGREEKDATLEAPRRQHSAFPSVAFFLSVKNI